MSVAVVGNFDVAWRTEAYISRAIAELGHRTLRFVDNDTQFARAARSDVDVVVWVRSTPHASPAATWEAIRAFRERRVPVIGFHPDLWFGLARQHRVLDRSHPFFAGVDVLCTTDGGHDDEWAAAGIEHWWVPQAIDRVEALREPRRHGGHVADIVFVGGWQGYPHPEWPQRHELIAHLRARWGHRLGLYPVSRHAQVRTQRLTEVIRGARVVVGDACRPDGRGRYWSNRVPETLGRGGLLLHPAVDGLADIHPHVRQWSDLDDLDEHIRAALADPETTALAAKRGRAHTIEAHTYTHRWADVLDRARDLGDARRVPSA